MSVTTAAPDSTSPSLATLTHLPTSVPIIASTLCLPLESTYLIHAPSRPHHRPTTVCDLQGHPLFRFDPLHLSRSGRLCAAMYHAALPESPLLTVRKSVNFVPWFSSSAKYSVYPGGSGRARSGSSWPSLSSLERHAPREAPSLKVEVHRPRTPWKKQLTVTAVAAGSDVSLYVPNAVGNDGEFDVMMLVHGEAKSHLVARARRCGGRGNQGDAKHSRHGEGQTFAVDVANGLDIGAACAFVVVVNVYART